jgi:transposase
MGVYAIYDDEFKANAAAMVARGDRSAVTVASDLGVPLNTLRYWCASRKMKRKRKGAPPCTTAGPTQETNAEKIARLERENFALRKDVESLRMDREILKKAAAFFAKESE